MADKQDNSANEDDQAIQQMASLWVRHQSRIAAFISTAVSDFHVAEDLLQDVAVDVAKKFGDYDQQRPFAPWAVGIARNCVAAYYRKQGTAKVKFGDNFLSEISEAMLRIEKTSLDDRYEALEHCLESLSGDSRRVIEQRYRLTRSVSEIGEAMQLSVSAVSVRLHRIRKSLAECVERRMSSGDQPAV